MNLYREIKAGELIDHINLLFEEEGIIDFDTKKEIENSVKTSSKNATKKLIRAKLKYDYSSQDVQDFCNELFKLYKALGLVNAGQKIYTDL